MLIFVKLDLQTTCFKISWTTDIYNNFLIFTVFLSFIGFFLIDKGKQVNCGIYFFTNEAKKLKKISKTFEIPNKLREKSLKDR